MRKNWIKILVFFLVFYSCKEKKISSFPFEVDKDITCDDLYKNGYKRSFGVDVILLGKKSQDTIIYYEVYQKLTFKKEDFHEEVKLDTVKKDKKSEEYLKQDPLVLSDSIYSLVWGNIKEQQRNICKKSRVTWRNYIVKIGKDQIKNYKSKIDSISLKIIDSRKFDFSTNEPFKIIEEFKVVNKIKRDTFNCSIYKDNNGYYFSSTISLKK